MSEITSLRIYYPIATGALSAAGVDFELVEAAASSSGDDAGILSVLHSCVNPPLDTKPCSGPEGVNLPPTCRELPTVLHGLVWG